MISFDLSGKNSVIFLNRYHCLSSTSPGGGIVLGILANVVCQGVFSNRISFSVSLQEFSMNTTRRLNAKKWKWCISDIPFSADCVIWESKNLLQL